MAMSGTTLVKNNHHIMAFTPPATASRKAFSLVEVTLALGVAAFVLVAILGLLSNGIQMSHQSKAELQSAQVASSLLAIRRAAPTLELPDCPLPILTNAVPTLQSLLLDRAGRKVSSLDKGYYSMFYTIEPLGGRTARVYLSLTHPPVPNAAEGYRAISKAEEFYETTTYVRLR